jgi:N6-adenosine-specific RNA methylase IME4
MNELPLFHFGVILADPPWRFANYSAKGEEKNPVAHYNCMDLQAIKEMRVGDLAKPDSALIMWATAPMLPQALETMKAWGFVFKTAGAWGKLSKLGEKIAFGTGYVYRSAAEFYLLGTIGNPPIKSRSIRNLILAPIREHSRKPDQMHTDIEALFDGPYLELFARSQRPGWTCWGNQTDKFVPPSADIAPA